MAEEFNGQSHYERTEHEASNKAKKVNVYQWNPGSLQWERSAGAPVNYQSRIELATTSVYFIGKAPIGATTSAASWQLKKLDTSTIALIKTWADGNDNFDNTWDGRAGKTYS